jgi:aspartyl/asparaginyl-tRNA synthetase
MSGSSLIIDTKKFHFVTNKLREFFISKGFLECHPQNRLSILAACENPFSITSFDYLGERWPLPQTGQMWLEYELLTDPSVPGYFCVSTSYRQEPNPLPGRHDHIFPMFEFELKGDLAEMEVLERELLEHLGYGKKDCFPGDNYLSVAEKYDTKEIEHEHEQRLYKEHGAAFFLRNFPEYTSPFWNMKRYDDGNTAKKIDVILSGMETIGSAERSCDVEQMKERFATIMDGTYAQTIYDKFGKERVDKEMDEFMKHNFFTRSGGGIGITRLISSMTKEGLIPDDVISSFQQK